jgi:aminotransferase
VHDFLTVGAASPLQQAGVMALSSPESYYQHLADEYAGRRDHIVSSLEAVGFKCFVPRGAYYVMADISAFDFTSDVAFIRHLIEKIGIAAVPGSSFYAQFGGGSQVVRFCFCKSYETLEKARLQLLELTSP